MYACIHCDFDNTLVVLGKQSKKLKLLGEFKVKDKVELKWSKSEIYTGIIVKINESQDFLDEFAIKAVSKFLKRPKSKDLPEAIFTYNHTEPELNSKRCRTSTKKINESKEQENQFSPKKQKKHKDNDEPNQEPPLAVTKKSKKNQKQNENVNATDKEKVKNPSKIKADKKKAEENVAKSQGNQMFGLSNLEVQFRDESSENVETVLSTSEERNNSEMLPSKPASSTDANLTASFTDMSNILPLTPSIFKERSHSPSTSSTADRSNILPLTPSIFKESSHSPSTSSTADRSNILSSTASIFSERSHAPSKSSTSADRSNILPLTPSLDVIANKRAGSMPSTSTGSILEETLHSTETSLTSTWELCKSLYDVDNSEQTCSYTTLTEMNFPVPSPVVLEFLDLLTNKEVQNFCLKLSQHYKKKKDEASTESSADNEFPLNVMESMDCAPTYSELMPQNSQTLGLRRSPRKHLSSPASFTGNSTSQPYDQTSGECTSTQKSREEFSATIDLNQYQEAPIQQIQRSPFSRQHCPSAMNSPPQHSPQIQRSPFSRQHCPSAMNSPTQHSPQIQRSPFSTQHCPSAMNSPTQHNMQSHDSDQSDDNKMVKLLQTSDIQVRRGSLRKAHTNASKGAPQRTSFKLASSLLPLLFSVEELANSCGQGLKKKTNDVRTPLDPVKIGVLKDYVTAWCTKNNRCMEDAQINDAVTEQVSYARKKLRKL